MGAIQSLGVFEGGRFVGVIVFGKGATSALVKRYGYEQHQGCELVRVAFAADHKTPVSRSLGIALRLLRRQNPGLELVVTFADPTRHHGGIYQATGWVYSGLTSASTEYVVDGVQHHGRAFRHLGIPEDDPRVTKVLGTAKHRYLYPLTPQAKQVAEKFRLPYPRATASVPAEPSSTP